MAINNHIQFIRGTKAQNEKYLGQEGEITIDLTDKRIHVHDHETIGGYKMARLDEIPTYMSQLINDKGYALSGGNVATADAAIRDKEGNDIATTYAKLSGALFTGNTSFSDGELYYNKTIAPNQNDNMVATTTWVNDTNNNVVHKDGKETITGQKTFTQLIQGTAMSANWADLAEYYESDCEYAFGTLVAFGGEKEITIATTEANAVVSKQPGLILNGTMASAGGYLPIALCGRVEILVNGEVHKFDKIVLDKRHPGRGTVDNEAKDPIAIALDDKVEGEETVLCVSKFKF